MGTKVSRAFDLRATLWNSDNETIAEFFNRKKDENQEWMAIEIINTDLEKDYYIVGDTGDEIFNIPEQPYTVFVYDRDYQPLDEWQFEFFAICNKPHILEFSPDGSLKYYVPDI